MGRIFCWIGCGVLGGIFGLGAVLSAGFMVLLVLSALTLTFVAPFGVEPMTVLVPLWSGASLLATYGGPFVVLVAAVYFNIWRERQESTGSYEGAYP